MTRLLLGGAFAVALLLFSTQSAQAQYVTYSYSVGYAPPVAPVVVARPAVVVRPYAVVPRPVAVVRPAPILTPVRTVARPVARAAAFPFRPRVYYRYGF
ncbi:MAG: hypothetical protein AAFX06_18465 [Planctomycetota bacterium]